MREATQLLKEPVEVVSGSLRTYTKRLQVRSVCAYFFFHVVSHNFFVVAICDYVALSFCFLNL